MHTHHQLHLTFQGKESSLKAPYLKSHQTKMQLEPAQEKNEHYNKNIFISWVTLWSEFLPLLTISVHKSICGRHQDDHEDNFCYIVPRLDVFKSQREGMKSHNNFILLNK